MSRASEYAELVAQARKRPKWTGENGLTWAEITDDGRARFSNTDLKASEALALAHWLLDTFGESA